MPAASPPHPPLPLLCTLRRRQQRSSIIPQGYRRHSSAAFERQSSRLQARIKAPNPGVSNDRCAIAPHMLTVPPPPLSRVRPCAGSGQRRVIAGKRAQSSTDEKPARRPGPWAYFLAQHRATRTLAPLPLTSIACLPYSSMPQDVPPREVKSFAPAACSDFLGPGSVVADRRLLGAASEAVCGLPLFTFLSLSAFCFLRHAHTRQ